MRAITAGFLAALVLVSATAAPLGSSSDASSWATRIAADGSVERVRAQLVDTVPVPSSEFPDTTAWMLRTQQAPPPTPPDVLAQEKARPTREITFYGHVFGSGMVAPANGGSFGPDGPQAANTVFPTGDANLGLGVFDWCSDTVNFNGLTPPQPSSWNNCDKDPFNKLALFLTAGPVQVHSRDEFAEEGFAALHNERGRTKDVVLDTTASIKASMWMSLDYHAWSVGNGNDNTFCPVGLPPDVGCPYPYWGWDPAIWPGWVVEAKLFMVELGEYGQGASEPPPIFEAWNSDAMTLVASGATEPTEVTNGLPGNPNVHEFEVDLGPALVDVIPKTNDIVLVFSFYSIINGQKVAAHTWRIWAGELFPVRFTLPVKNALDVELVIPQFIHEKLLLHGVIASAFGSYDVDLDSATVTVTDSANAPVQMTRFARVGDFQVAHGAHFKPVNLTWIWDYKADNLRPGAYKAVIQACNHQGSACSSTEAAFSIGQDLRPTSVTVGRSGQRTVTEGQLRDLTGGQASTQALPAGAVQSPMDDRDDRPREAPGLETLMILGAAAAVALSLRRRWT